MPLLWTHQPESIFFKLPAVEPPSPILLLTAPGLFSAFKGARRHQLFCISGVWTFPAPSAQRAAEQLQKWGFGAQRKLQLKPCSPSRTSLLLFSIVLFLLFSPSTFCLSHNNLKTQSNDLQNLQDFQEHPSSAQLPLPFLFQHQHLLLCLAQESFKGFQLTL